MKTAPLWIRHFNSQGCKENCIVTTIHGHFRLLDMLQFNLSNIYESLKVQANQEEMFLSAKSIHLNHWKIVSSRPPMNSFFFCDELLHHGDKGHFGKAVQKLLNSDG